MEKTSTKNKKGRKAKGYLALVAVIILVFGAFVLLQHPKSNYGNNYLDSTLFPNGSDISNVIGSNYSIGTANGLSNFTGALRNEGFLETSTEVLTPSLPINKYGKDPATISLIVYVMSNNSSASSNLKNFLFGNNANFTPSNSSGGSYNASIKVNGKNISIYTIYSVELLNASIVNTTNSYKYGLLSMPVFQSTSIFSYKNYICIAVLNGYTENMSLTDGINISKIWALRMAENKL